MPQALDQVQIALAHPTRLYVGARWVDALEGGRIEVVSPHSEEVIAIVAEATESDIDAAAAAARDASLPFGGFKQSGIGREGGKDGLAAFPELKSMLLTA